MNYNEFCDFFSKNIELNNIVIDFNNEELNELYIYMRELLKWNNMINVTSISNEKEFIIKHYIDSLLINKYLIDSNKIIDIGTGGGFPGIPLKIINKEKKFTLIDSVNKKLNVIREICKRLELKNIEIIHSRAEELAINKEYRQKYDIAVTRAVSRISTIVEYMLPFLKIGGKAICMKGPNFEQELKEAKNAINVLGGVIENIDTLFEYDNGKKIVRNIIIISKIKNTPNNFPRGNGKPLKNPII